MKKTLFQYIIFTLLFTTAFLHAETTQDEGRVQLQFNTQDDGGLSPQIFYPVYWNEFFYSAFGFQTSKTTTITEDDPALGGTDNSYTTSSDTQNYWVNLISYQNGSAYTNYSIGLTADYRQIKTYESAFVADGPSTGRTGLSSYENRVEVDVLSPGIYSDFALKEVWGFLSVRIAGYLYPISQLNVKQQTTLIQVNAADNAIETKSATMQEISYKALADIYFTLLHSLTLGFSGSYEMLPLKYDLATFNGTVNQVKTESTIMRANTKLVFTRLDAMGLNPMIGFEMIQQNFTVNGDGLPIDNENNFVFGLEKKF